MMETTPQPVTRRPYKKREPSTKPIPVGTIYKLESISAKKSYYGSAENIETRLKRHNDAFSLYKQGKKNYCSSYEILKEPDCKLVILEQKAWDNSRELKKREDYYITTFPCVNIRRSGGIRCVNEPRPICREAKTPEQLYKKAYNAEYRKRPDVIEAYKQKLQDPVYRRQLFDAHNHYRKIIYARKKKAEEEAKNLKLENQ